MISIVPCSHSRETPPAVSSVPAMVITMAMTPGTMASAERSSGLNQSRICRSMPPVARSRLSCCSPDSHTCKAPVT